MIEDWLVTVGRDLDRVMTVEAGVDTGIGARNRNGTGAGIEKWEEGLNTFGM